MLRLEFGRAFDLEELILNEVHRELRVLGFGSAPFRVLTPVAKPLFLSDWPHTLSCVVSGAGLGERDPCGLEAQVLLLWAAVLRQTLAWLCPARFREALRGALS